MRPFLLGLFAALVFAEDLDSGVIPEDFQLVVRKSGDICNIEQGSHEAEMDNQFFECIIPNEGPNAWAWPQLGVWSLRNCSIGYLFSPLSASCKNESSIRRQQACGWGGCGAQQVVKPEPWGQAQPWYQPTSGCGPQGCGQAQTWQPQPQLQTQPQVWQPQPQVWLPQPQPIYQPQPQAWSPCGPQGCPPVQPIQPIQPIIEPMPMPMPAPSPCGPQGCPLPPPPCGTPPQPRCQTPCGQPTCPQRVEKKPCPQASGGCAGQQCGQYCSWMLEKLRPGPGNGYQQCVPVPNPVSEYCGQWRPRKCGYGTKFHPQAQVCIRDPSVRPRPGPTCPQQQVPIGPCNQQQRCPGFSQCQQSTNTCCQQAQPWSG